MQDGVWSSRFTIFQLIVATVVLVAFFAAAWFLAAGDLSRLTGYCWWTYLIVTGFWVTRRIARALATALEMQGRDELNGLAAVGRLFEATLLPLYCGASLFAIAVVAGDVGESPGGTFLTKWFAPLTFAGHGLLGTAASAMAILCIWRRRGAAGWIAVTAAQALGAATVAASFYLSLPALIPADEHDTWYYWPANPPVMSVLAQAIGVLLGLLAVVRLWHWIRDDRRLPWATFLALLMAVGYLAGFGMLTGFWPSAWIYGAFFMTRIATYAFFLCEPKDQPIARSGWFVCYLVTLALCVATTAHQVTTGDFAMMMQPLLMEPLASVATEGSFWSFSLSLTLTLTRDILFLLWLNRIHPQGWADAIGIGILGLLYGPIAIGIALLGLGLLFPVLYPLAVTGPVDLIWPLAMIGALVMLLLRERHDSPATTSSA